MMTTVTTTTTNDDDDDDDDDMEGSRDFVAFRNGNFSQTGVL